MVNEAKIVSTNSKPSFQEPMKVIGIPAKPNNKIREFFLIVLSISFRFQSILHKKKLYKSKITPQAPLYEGVQTVNNKGKKPDISIKLRAWERITKIPKTTNTTNKTIQG